MSDQSWMGDDMDTVEARYSGTCPPSPAERLVGELAAYLDITTRRARAASPYTKANDLLARAAAFHDHAPALADTLRDVLSKPANDRPSIVNAMATLAAYDADTAPATPASEVQP